MPSKVLDSVRETIAIGEQGGLPTQVTHHKVIGKANWGRSVEALRLIDEARARGVDVTSDQYPYTASSTSISSALIPAWALEGGQQAQRARFADPVAREKVLVGIVGMIRDERGGGDPKNVQFANCGFDPTLNGKTLADATVKRGLTPTIEHAAETTLWIVAAGRMPGHLPRDERRRRGAHHAASGDDDCVGRGSPDVRPRQSASAQLRDVCARAGRLRAREGAS